MTRPRMTDLFRFWLAGQRDPSAATDNPPWVFRSRSGSPRDGAAVMIPTDAELDEGEPK